ncbi:MAG: hypothetical protein ABIH23_13825 [bacterium]
MTKSNPPINPNRILRYLLGVYAAVFLCSSLFHYQYLQDVFFSESLLTAIFISFRPIQLVFVFLGGVCLLASFNIDRILAKKKKAFVRRVTLVLLSLLPLVVLELTLRPFLSLYPTIPKESLYVEDDQLVWKLKPNFQGKYKEAEIYVNENGLRGPNIAYEKPEDVFRMMFLGDSVTFGHKIVDYTKTIPHLVQDHLTDTGGLKI